MFGAWLELGREHLHHAGEAAMCDVGAWRHGLVDYNSRENKPRRLD